MSGLGDGNILIGAPGSNSYAGVTYLIPGTSAAPSTQPSMNPSTIIPLYIINHYTMMYIIINKSLYYNEYNH